MKYNHTYHHTSIITRRKENMGDCSTKTSNENPSVELFMTILVNIGNILSILYNVPQMWRTHKLKKADDISSHFLWMRLSAGIIWSIYCIYYRMWYVIISWTTTIISTTQILYYKYYPSPLAQMPLIEEQCEQEQPQEQPQQWQQQDKDNREKEERTEMQRIQKNENRNYGNYYIDIIPLN
jgi:uncharacterized protein with PQ loop repeat